MKKLFISLIIALTTIALLTACKLNITYIFDGESESVPVTYTARTTIFVLSNNRNDDSISSSDLVMPPDFMQDIMTMLNSEDTLEEIAEKSGYTLSATQISRMLSCESESDTRIISISATSDDPQLSVTVADVAREVLSKEIVEKLDVETVNIVDTAKLIGN